MISPGGGGTPRKIGSGYAARFLKSYDFPFPIFELIKNSIPYLLEDLTFKSMPCFRRAFQLAP